MGVNNALCYVFKLREGVSSGKVEVGLKILYDNEALKGFSIGQVKEGVHIESSEVNREAIGWSQAVFATGTSIVNNTIDEIISLSQGKKLIFYGVTIAAAAYEFGYTRLCFESF